jgi:hypothetical protein
LNRKNGNKRNSSSSISPCYRSSLSHRLIQHRHPYSVMLTLNDSELMC